MGAEGRHFVITLNRPEVYNALNLETLRELMKIVEELAHPATRAVIITGAGEGLLFRRTEGAANLTEDQVRRFIHLIAKPSRRSSACPGRSCRRERRPWAADGAGFGMRRPEAGG